VHVDRLAVRQAEEDPESVERELEPLSASIRLFCEVSSLRLARSTSSSGERPTLKSASACLRPKTWLSSVRRWFSSDCFCCTRS